MHYDPYVESLLWGVFLVSSSLQGNCTSFYNLVYEGGIHISVFTRIIQITHVSLPQLSVRVKCRHSTLTIFTADNFQRKWPLQRENPNSRFQSRYVSLKYPFPMYMLLSLFLSVNCDTLRGILLCGLKRNLLGIYGFGKNNRFLM